MALGREGVGAGGEGGEGGEVGVGGGCNIHTFICLN